MEYVQRAEQTLSLINKVLSDSKIPHKVVGSFSGNRSKFSPESDLDIAVRAADVLQTVNLLKNALSANRIEETNGYSPGPGSPFHKRPGPKVTAEYTLFTADFTPVQIIGSLEE